MSGVFALVCPKCGRELQAATSGDRGCPSCHQAYLVRFGHVVSVRSDQPIGDPGRSAGFSASIISPGEG